MAVRVAVNSFKMKMTPAGALGNDDTGEAIRQGYSARLSEVIRIMQ